MLVNGSRNNVSINFILIFSSSRSNGRVKRILTGTGRPSLSIFPFYIKGSQRVQSAFRFEP